MIGEVRADDEVVQRAKRRRPACLSNNRVGRILGIRPSSQLAALGRPALVGAVLMIAAYWLSEEWVAESWIWLILGIGTTVVAILPVAFYGGVSRDLRPRFTQRLRSSGGGPREP